MQLKIQFFHPNPSSFIPSQHKCSYVVNHTVLHDTDFYFVYYELLEPIDRNKQTFFIHRGETTRITLMGVPVFHRMRFYYRMVTPNPLLWCKICPAGRGNCVVVCFVHCRKKNVSASITSIIEVITDMMCVYSVKKTPQTTPYDLPMNVSHFDRWNISLTRSMTI